MCTLTFIPGLPGGGYLLAVNRDESPRRTLAQPPAVQRSGARQVIAPRDPDGGGTWIGVDDSGYCVAILNGDRPLPLGLLRVEEGGLVSRGLLVQDLLGDPRFRSVRDELERRHRLDALHYKPFKLVVVSPGPSSGEGRPAQLLRVDWDGSMLRAEEERGPRCVVSSGVETEAVTRFRRAAFEGFVQQQSRHLEPAASEAARGALVGALAGFHASHHPESPQGNARSVCMHRDEARTVSSTLVHVSGDRITVNYLAGWPCQQPPVQTASMPRVASA